MTTDILPRYERAMRYTVEIAHTVRLEVDRLDDALDLCRRLRRARSDTSHTVNLVAWPTGMLSEGNERPTGAGRRSGRHRRAHRPLESAARA